MRLNNYHRMWTSGLSIFEGRRISKYGKWTKYEWTRTTWPKREFLRPQAISPIDNFQNSYPSRRSREHKKSICTICSVIVDLLIVAKNHTWRHICRLWSNTKLIGISKNFTNFSGSEPSMLGLHEYLLNICIQPQTQLVICCGQIPKQERNTVTEKPLNCQAWNN